jgi:hypothetical protein
LPDEVEVAFNEIAAFVVLGVSADQTVGPAEFARRKISSESLASFRSHTCRSSSLIPCGSAVMTLGRCAASTCVCTIFRCSDPHPESDLWADRLAGSIPPTDTRSGIESGAVHRTISKLISAMPWIGDTQMNGLWAGRYWALAAGNACHGPWLFHATVSTTPKQRRDVRSATRFEAASPRETAI